jgi:hypothetical protein
LTEVDRAVTRVLENPRAFPVIRRRHLVRRALTQSFTEVKKLLGVEEFLKLREKL